MDELRSLVSVAIALPVASGRTFRWQPRAAVKAGGGERGGEGGASGGEGGRRCEGDSGGGGGRAAPPEPEGVARGSGPCRTSCPFWWWSSPFLQLSCNRTARRALMTL